MTISYHCMVEGVSIVIRWVELSEMMKESPGGSTANWMSASFVSQLFSPESDSSADRTRVLKVASDSLTVRLFSKSSSPSLYKLTSAVECNSSECGTLSASASFDAISFFPVTGTDGLFSGAAKGFD